MALRDPLNRPMRTRMSGGVAGESGRPLPLCQFELGTGVIQEPPGTAFIAETLPKFLK
jgi:hypothetical protein